MGNKYTIPHTIAGKGKQNKQKEFEIEKAKNELAEIENQIASLYEMLKNNYQNAVLNLNSQKTKVDLIKKVYQNEKNSAMASIPYYFPKEKYSYYKLIKINQKNMNYIKQKYN